MYYHANKRFNIIAVVAGVIILWCIIFIIDYLMVDNNKAPIFCISIGESMDDGGSDELYGLFYKVNKYVYLSDDTTKYEMGTWFLEFSKPQYNVNIYKEFNTQNFT